LFLSLRKDYSVLNPRISGIRIAERKKKFGLTAGLPVTLEGLVGADGSVWGMKSFGFSAPYQVLDEKLGYTGKKCL